MSVRLEQYDGGEVLYIALDPDGVWSRSEFPDDLVTIDYNAQGRVIGVETVGSAARAGLAAMLEALLNADAIREREAVRQLLKSELGSAG